MRLKVLLRIALQRYVGLASLGLFVGESLANL